MALQLLASEYIPCAFQGEWSRLSPIRPCQFQRCRFSCDGKWKIVHKPSTRRVVLAQFRMPEDMQLQMNIIKKLWRSDCDSIQQFPWKKAEDIIKLHLLVVGKKAFQWSFIVWFIASILSDFLIIISRNQELVIHFGLFTGCLFTNLMKEILEQFFNKTEVKDSSWYLLVLGFFHILLKLVSTLRSWPLIVHVANGGFIQTIWMWRLLLQENLGPQSA